ncbi:unnamed protein product, partial [Closterium sp. NIES-54]
MMELSTSTAAVSWLRLCAMARPSSLPSSALLMPQVRKARLMRSVCTAFEAREIHLTTTSGGGFFKFPVPTESHNI